jgi:hypothetical protein
VLAAKTLHFGVEQELQFKPNKPYRMQIELWDLNPTELRNLISQETRKFLWVLDFGGKIEDLEAIRKRLRSMADILRQKESGAKKTKA